MSAMNSIAVPQATDGSKPPVARLSRRRFYVVLGIVLLLIIGAGVLWFSVLKNMYIPRNWGVVEPGMIYRSGQVGAPIIEKTLKENKIRTIIFMSSDKKNQTPIAAEIKAAETLGIERLNFPLNGNGTGDFHQYSLAVAAIDKSVKAGKPVLVHCHTGAQRTSGAIGYYRLLVQRRSAKETYEEIHSYGHDESENPLLVPFMNQHMKEVADELIALGVIKEAPSPLPVITP